MYWKTVSPILKSMLLDLMNEELFNPFRLVGGTALSLQCGHRMSVDIDLFTDFEYASLDFELFANYLAKKYPYCEYGSIQNVGMGTYFKIGPSALETVKIDIYYTDTFVFNKVKFGTVRMASIEEIIAMKLDVISRTGRKKDFWDLHLFIDQFSFEEMLNLYQKRYPYNDSTLIRMKLTDFEFADNDFDPICLLGKEWEIIKLDFFEKFNQKVLGKN